MLYQINVYDGSKMPLANEFDANNAIAAGQMITDDSGFIYDNSINPGSLISIAGGYLLKGCPTSVIYGGKLTPPQVPVMIQNAAMLQRYGYTACLAQAQAMAGQSSVPNTGVSNAPSSAPATGAPAPAQPTNQAYTNANTAAATAPSQQPGTPSGLPTGVSSLVGGQMLNTTYRFILQVAGGYATGANRPGCSQTNSAACDPQFFTSLSDAIQYAINNGEVPYQTQNASDAWNLMAGTETINPAQIYNADGSLGQSITNIQIFGIPAWMLIAAGVGAYLLTR